MDKTFDPKDGQRHRMAHRIGIAVFLLVLLGAIAGLLGKGPLSKVRAQTSDATLWAESCRFIRYQAPMDLKLRVEPRAISNGLLHLRIGKTFVEDVEIERIEPEPESQMAGASFFTYAIRAETNASTEIRIRFAASHFGRLGYEVRAGDGEVLHLRHFAFP
jgi:hypothetical protein